MKKNLIIFILLAIVLIVIKLAYTKYCQSNINECSGKKINQDFDGLPQDGIDY
jgi:Tfp pilus assembly protein PilO